MVKNGKLIVSKASLYDINKAIEEKDLKERPLEEIVLEQYHEFLLDFSNMLANSLPLHRPGIDHKVRLKDGETPAWGPFYSMSRAELVVLKEWLGVNVSKGFIRQSSSLYAGPELFANKPGGGGGQGFCIDYQDIHSKNIKNQYPLPLMKETLNHLRNAGILTKLDIRGA